MADLLLLSDVVPYISDDGAKIDHILCSVGIIALLETLRCWMIL
jgi:hypothetical protein